jgi:hypothetical protein
MERKELFEDVGIGSRYRSEVEVEYDDGQSPSWYGDSWYGDMDDGESEDEDEDEDEDEAEQHDELDYDEEFMYQLFDEGGAWAE